MLIKQVMYKKVFTISPQKSLGEAMKQMIKKQASGLVVVDNDNKVIGIVSEKDVYRSFHPSYSDFFATPVVFTDYQAQEADIKVKIYATIESVMTKNVISVSPRDEVMKVGAIMLAKNIHRIPVIDDQGKLVGVVTRGCIYKVLFKKYLKLK